MEHFKLKVLYSFFVILGISGVVLGQSTGSVERVKAIEPFLNAKEVHVQQDSGEDLWITTPFKVMRYNSAEVFTYNKFRGIPSEIGNKYLSTYQDSNNNIWLAADKGLAVLNENRESFKFISSITGSIYTMLEDESAQMWIAAENGIFKLNVDSDKTDFGISRFLSENTMAKTATIFNNHVVFGGPNGILTINLQSGKFNQVETGNFRDLQITSAIDLPHFVLFGTDAKGFYKLDSDLKLFQKIYTTPYELSSTTITGLERFDNEIIVTTDGLGLYRLNEDLRLEEKHEQTPSTIYSSYLNDQNLLWIVSKQGLFLENFASYAIDHLKNDPAKYSSLADNYVTATESDSRGNIWFGTGKGLSIWNPETNRWRHIKNLNYKRTINQADNITDLDATGEHIWVATENDGVYKININTLLRAHYSEDALNKTDVRSARALFIDAQENIWIGGDSGYLTKINTSNEISTFPIKNVNAVAELGPKQLIVATKSRVHSLDPGTGRITDLEVLNADKDLTYYAINDLKITQSGLGLIATEGAGLISYDFEENKVKRLSTEDGLPSNNIEGIFEKDEPGYWLSTDNGLAFYSTENGTLKVYTELNGLSTNELTTGFAKLQDGSLVLGSSKGINFFRPKTLLAQQEFKPKVKLESLLLPGEIDNAKKKISLIDKNEISIDENNGFQVNFAGISHLNPDSIQYSWKLEGLDSEWSKPTPVNTANYSNLAPGTYMFKVRARLANSAWTTPVELPVNVNAVSGRISSVYLFMGIGILASVIIFIVVFNMRSRNADRQAREELRAQLQQEFQKPVESAVKSLNKISAAASNGNPEDLQRYAARFDELFNQILNFNYKESVYEISKINLKTHLPQIVKEIEPVYRLKDLEMIINDQCGDQAFYYNMEMLDKIFFSLISGSAGYSFKEGKIIVNLIRTNVGDLKLQITDNGRGMPAHDVKVLDKQRQIDSRPGSRDKSGVRYILKAKELVQKAGGNFSYETEMNEGSTFTVVLKNRKEDYRKVPERAANILRAETRKTVATKPELPAELNNMSESKILVIEGDDRTRELLVKSIGKYCQVYQVSNAEEGLEKAAMIFPDLIISSTVLPDINVFQLSKMLKRNIGLNHISTILIANEDQVLAEDELTGFVKIIRRPVQINLMLTKITKVLTWQKELRSSYLKSYKEDTSVKFRNETDEKFIANLSDLIVHNIENDNFSVHDLSAAVGISSNTLFMKLKNLVDLSPQDFMEFTRLNYARALMATGDLTIMEVAYKSGFSSSKILYASFKKFYGYDLIDNIEKP